MRMHEPIGNPVFGPLIARLPLGAYFMLAGLEKLNNLPSFIEEVHKFNILPSALATLYGTLLPYVEIGAGGLMVLGLWTTLATILTSLMLISFIYALGVHAAPNSRLFNKDIILLGTSLSLLYSGAGAWSIDRFRKTG